MPGISLTNNTGLLVGVASADGNATLTHYLTHPLTFVTKDGLQATLAQTVGDLNADSFPISASAGGEGKFAVEGSTLDVQAQAAASVGLLKGADADDFFDAVQWTPNQASANLVSFAVQGTVSAGDTAQAGQFSFGVTKGATVQLTSYCTAAATEKYLGALQRAIAALTIPHGIDDLKGLPVNAVCQIDAVSSLKFTASAEYDFFTNALATATIPVLPKIAVNASAKATIEATATHTSDHTITVAKVSDGVVHVSVSLTKTDDLEASLTVSAGVEGDVGQSDALGFLLGIISPNSTLELEKIRAEMNPAAAHKLGTDIKAAIDAAVSHSLQASLKASLEKSVAKNRMFVFAIDLKALDATSTAAVTLALKGDFTKLTADGAKLAGVTALDSALTTTDSTTRSLNLHLLGLFNYGSTDQFVKAAKADFTKDTREIVLSDERIEVMSDSLRAEKLRQVVVKAITLTLPASAKTPDAKTPIQTVFFDRRAGASASQVRQFANVLKAIGGSGAGAAQSLVAQKLGDNGVVSLYLALSLNPTQCRALFIDTPTGVPYVWTTYLRHLCEAERIILDGDSDNEGRLALFSQTQQFWEEIRDVGNQPGQIKMLTAIGAPQTATIDVTTAIWWSVAMEKYATTLASGGSIEKAGEGLAKTSTLGADEPWLVLALWKMLGGPAVESIFTHS